MALVSFAQRLSDLAAADPEFPAVTCGGRTVSRGELQRLGNRFARDLQSRGVGVGDFVTVALPNSINWFVAYLGCWKTGAVPQPVSAKLPARELAEIVALAESKVVVGAEPDSLPGTVCLPVGYQPPTALDDGPLPDAISPAWKAPTSGGSTGRPKLIVAGDASVLDDDAPPALGLQRDGCMVMPGPLYHNGPAVWSCQSWLAGSHVVLHERFDAERVLADIEHYRADLIYVVPTMMKRILRLPDEVRLEYDLSSLRVVWHLAEPCPMWLKEAWIDWLGAEKIFELYAGTEAQAITVITGTEWLEHRGSVGRPSSGEFKVTDPDGNELPVGEMGEIWLRPTRETATYHYKGAEPRTLDGGWESLGDMGWFDADGYLYLGDRMQDMILSGGANIYPAEVEAAIQEHPGVKSVCVIGLPDEDKGNVVHAIIEAEPGAIDEQELLEFAAERLAKYKLPRTVEFVDTPLRDDAGKVRRAALRGTPPHVTVSSTRRSPCRERYAARRAEDENALWGFHRAVRRVAVIDSILAEYATSYCGLPVRRRDVLPMQSAVEVPGVTWTIDGEVMVEFLPGENGPSWLIVREIALLSSVKKQLRSRHVKIDYRPTHGE